MDARYAQTATQGRLPSWWVAGSPIRRESSLILYVCQDLREHGQSCIFWDACERYCWVHEDQEERYGMKNSPMRSCKLVANTSLVSTLATLCLTAMLVIHLRLLEWYYKRFKRAFNVPLQYQQITHSCSALTLPVFKPIASKVCGPV